MVEEADINNDGQVGIINYSAAPSMTRCVRLNVLNV